MPGAPSSPLFFVHIQKTAGGTLRHLIRRSFPRGAVYPEGGFDDSPLDSYWEIDRLLAISPERRQQIRAFVGHFPYIAAELVDMDVVTLSVLRDPVERTVSYLKMRSKDPGHEHMSFEEIYDDPFDFPCFIHNHQTKIFSMGRGDKLETFMDIIPIDRERLEVAKVNVEKVDILGLQERSDEVIAAVADVLGIPTIEVDNQHVGREDRSVSPSLLERIAADNAIDVELYQFGRALYEQRGGPSR